MTRAKDPTKTDEAKAATPPAASRRRASRSTTGKQSHEDALARQRARERAARDD
jgi:hypothetical protein